MTGDVTVGIDIGTTSVKAVSVSGAGTILARARIPHRVVAPHPDRFEHHPRQAWIDGVLAAWGVVSARGPVAAVTVSAMVPSLCGVDGSGVPVTAGLLYGDGRGRSPAGGSDDGEAVGFARWLAGQEGVESLWPAQAVANHALCGVGVINSSTAMAMVPLYDGQRWDPDRLDELALSPEQLPSVSSGELAVGERDGTAVSGGTVDVLAEQFIAPADAVGDVLVMCGTTLLPWVLTDDWLEVEGLWTIPYTSPGLVAVGGASSAGGLFIDRVRQMVGDIRAEELLSLGPDDLPVWLPYPRGERTPLHDPNRRADLLDLHVGHTSAHVLMAAYEAAGFVVRHHLDRAGINPTRIVATGGGTRSAPWMQALADTTGLTVDVSAEPEGAALGAAYIARVTAGLEPDTSGARRWGRIGHRVEPRHGHVTGCESRYRRFREGTDREGTDR